MTLKIKGLDGIEKGLQRMERSVRADKMGNVLKASARPMEREYAGGAPQVIRRGVRTREVDKRPNVSTVAVGSRHPLVAIEEFGTRRRRTNRGRGRGRIIAKGFARRAFDTNVHGWFRDIGRLLWREVKRGSR